MITSYFPVLYISRQIHFVIDIHFPSYLGIFRNPNAAAQFSASRLAVPSSRAVLGVPFAFPLRGFGASDGSPHFLPQTLDLPATEL